MTVATEGTNKRGFLHDAFSVLGSKVFVLGLAFVTGIIITRLLGPEGKGIYAALLVFPTLFMSVAEMGVRQASVYHLGRDSFGDKATVETILFLLVVSSLVGISICALTYFLLGNSNFTLMMISLALGFIPLSLTASYASGIFLGKRAISRFNRIKWLPELVKLAAVILLVGVLGLGVVGTVAALIIAGAVTALYSLKLVSDFAAIKLSFQPVIMKSLLSLGVVYALALFVLQLNYRIDIVMLERLGSAAELGQYATGVTIAELLWQLPSVLGVVIFSHRASSQDGAAFTQQVAKLLRVILLVAVLGGGVLWAVAGFLMPAIYGDAFAPSAEVVRLLMPGVVAFTLFKVLNMDLAGRGRPLVSLTVMGPAVILNIILNLALIPARGANGAALASTISYSCGATLFIIVYAKETGLSLGQLLRYKRSDFDFLVNLRNKLGRSA